MVLDWDTDAVYRFVALQRTLARRYAVLDASLDDISTSAFVTKDSH
jgi:hypothetical protein